MNSLRALAGVALAGVAAAVVAGCGSDVPSNAVARIGDTVITKQQFDHWFESAARGQQQAGGPPAVPSPDDDFQSCVTALKKAQPKGAKTKDADLRKQCKQSYDALRQQVMQFLIQSQWVLKEAEEQGIEVSDKEIRTLFEDQKQQAFPNEKDYKRFLKTSGSTEKDILFRVKLDTLQTRLTEKIQQDQEKVTDEDVREYYEKNKERFAQPERRDLNVVLTKTKAKAEQAKREIAGGASFKSVSKQYSIDEASKANDGKLPDMTKGQQEKALDDAVFGAEKGELQGPVKTQFGWYVFEVTDVTPADQQSLKDASETIRNLLRSEREQTALQDFIEGFREEYKSETKCRKGFIVAECSNAPQEETDTAPGQGAPPPQQGAPQQGAPAPSE